MDPSYNSFGSFGSGGTSGGQPGTIASAPQAVVTSAPKKKSYRWLIAVVILLLIGVGVGVGVFVLMRNLDTTSEIQSAYKAYAEYVIYGTEGEYQIDAETFDIPVEEYVVAEYSSMSMSSDEEYFDKLQEKLDILKYNIENGSLDETESEGIENILSSHEAFMNLYRFSSQVLRSDMVLMEFLADSGAGLLRRVDGMLADSGDDDWRVMFLTLLKSNIEEQIKRYEAISGFGCMDSNGINDGCIDELTEEEVMSIPLAGTGDFVLRSQNDFVYSVFTDTLGTMHAIILGAIDA